MLAIVHAAQKVFPWTSAETAPKRSDLKAWADHLCSVVLAGASHENRRHLFKTLLHVHGNSTIGLRIRRTRNGTMRRLQLPLPTTPLVFARPLPYSICAVCPTSVRRAAHTQRGIHTSVPDVEWERPVCDKCGWAGEPARIDNVPESSKDNSRGPPESECIVVSVPIRKLRRPSD